MKATDLFIVILKVFGIYLIKDIFLTIPPLLYETGKLWQLSETYSILSFMLYLLLLAVRVLIVYLLLFKTEYLVAKLQLTRGLSEEPIRTNMHRSSLYTIAIICTGVIVLVFAIPDLIYELYQWYEYLDSRKRYITDYSFDFGGLLTSIARVIVGLLLLGNQKQLVNFIELRQRQAGK